MRTFATKNKEAETISKNEFKKSMPVLQVENFFEYGKSIQRKADCACGGGCPGCQTKKTDLSISSPDDASEKEADAMAEKVMRMQINEPASFSSSDNKVSRKCDNCEEEEEKLQLKEKSNDSHDFASAVVRDVLNSNGKPLNKNTRNFMESRFNYDFSRVKIHDNSLAAKSADSINALAYTSGNNIVFNSGQYNPSSDSGKRLLAHELTHVIQQNSDSVKRNVIQRISVSSAGGGLDGTCGRFKRRFIFTLDNSAPTDGYMVQQIERYNNEVECPGTGVCPANPDLTFWEAFFVQSGSTAFYRQAALGLSDESSHPARPNTAGARYAMGEIRFFPIAVTGNLGRNNTAGLWNPGNAGGVSYSMSLPSTSTRPTWWGSHTEGPATRFVTADWRCCPDGNNFNQINASVT